MHLESTCNNPAGRKKHVVIKTFKESAAGNVCQWEGA